jgi:hypothetical protein
MAVKDKEPRFRGTVANIHRLLRQEGCDHETILFMLGTIAQTVEGEETELRRLSRVYTGLTGRANDQGPHIILTATSSTTEVNTATFQKWGLKASVTDMTPRVVSVPKPTNGGPQKVALMLDTVTQICIDNLLANAQVEIGGATFKVSFDYHQQKSLILAPDKLYEEKFKKFMTVMVGAGFNSEEIEFALASMVRKSLGDNDLNPWAVTQNLEREIVTVQFQIMGALGAPGISPADWAVVSDLRRAPRIFLVLRTEPMRDLLLEHVESLKLFFFLGVSPRKDECLLYGLFNIQPREQRRFISSLEQGHESNRAALQQTAREAAGAAEAVQRVAESRDRVLNAEKKREANEGLRARCEILLKTLMSLPHKVFTELSQGAREDLEPTFGISPHLNDTEFNEQMENMLPTSGISKIVEGINNIGKCPPTSIWIQGAVFQATEALVRQGSPNKKSWGQRDRLEVTRLILAPVHPLFITAVSDFKTLKMVVIDVRPEEVELLMTISDMQKDKPMRGVTTGVYTAKGEWGTAKVKWHMKGLAGEGLSQPAHDQFLRLVMDALAGGEMITVPRRSPSYGTTIVDGEGHGELASDTSDLLQGPDPSCWERMEVEGTDEILSEDLRQALRVALRTATLATTTISLAEAVGAGLEVPPVSMGSFIRIGDE